MHVKSKNHRILILATLTAALVHGVAAAPVELIPSTASWYGVDKRISNIREGGVRLSGDGVYHAMHYFAPSGSPRELKAGETIRATYQFEVDGPKDTGQAFRVALLNSGGSRVTGNTGLTDPAFTNYKGYGAFFNPTPESPAGMHQLRLRPGGNDNLISSVKSWPNSGGAILARGDAPTLVEKVRYTGVLTITMEKPGQVTITHEVTGGAANAVVTRTTATDVLTAFDTFIVAVTGSKSAGTLMNALRLYSVKIE